MGYTHVPDDDETSITDDEGDKLVIDRDGNAGTLDIKVQSELNDIKEILHEMLEQLKIITGA